jgi:hypothetical protein
MSQNVFNQIVPTTTSGNQLAVILNDFKDAVVSGFSGTTRPSATLAGGYWIDISNPTLWAYKMYTGAQDVTIFTLNLTTGSSSISAADSFFEIARISNDSIGPILRLVKERASGNGQTLNGDILGEIEFQATRDSGVNVISARIRSISTDNTTSSAQGSYLVFEASVDNEGSISEMMRLVDGKLGIGITSPSKELHVAGGMKLEKESDDSDGADIELKKKRITNQGQVLSGDFISKIELNSHDNNDNNVPGVLVEVKASENHTSTGHGTSISIKNKKPGQTTFTEQIFISDKVEIKGDIEIAGNLTVNGTTTTVNTETLDVEDSNILVNKGGTQLTANTNKAGLTVDIVDGTDAIIAYDSSLTSKFKIGNVGSEAEVVTVSGNQTLTTKTIDADSNTISNLETDNLKTGVLNVATNLSGATDTQIPSALAVKTYIESIPSSIGASEVSFTVANNQSSFANITDLAFNPANIRSATIEYAIYRSTSLSQLAQAGELRIVYNTGLNKWFFSDSYAGQNAGVEFNVTNAGQIQYKSSLISGGSYAGTLKYSITKTFSI